MINIKVILILLSIISYNQNAFAEGKNCQKEQKICTYIKLSNNGYKIITQNKTPYITTLYLDIKGTNIKSKIKFPELFLLQPYSKKQIVLLKTKDANKSSKVAIEYSHLYGNYKLKNHSYIYSLPYQRNKSYIVGQSFNEGKTHSKPINHAIDWNMPIGTPIIAARSGRVVDVENKYNNSGIDDKYLDQANYIKILHDDGSSATYAHLKKDGAVVSQGDLISNGQLIGYSGNTGYSSGPHLHFHVSIPSRDGNKLIEKSINYSFRNCKNNSFVPISGTKYKAC